MERTSDYCEINHVDFGEVNMGGKELFNIFLKQMEGIAPPKLTVLSSFEIVVPWDDYMKQFEERAINGENNCLFLPNELISKYADKIIPGRTYQAQLVSVTGGIADNFEQDELFAGKKLLKTGANGLALAMNILPKQLECLSFCNQKKGYVVNKNSDGSWMIGEILAWQYQPFCYELFKWLRHSDLSWDERDVLKYQKMVAEKEVVVLCVFDNDK